MSGFLSFSLWLRDESKVASRSLPADAKESCRWVEGYERLAEQAALLSQTHLVYVADREGGIMALMAKVSALATPVDWLIRSSHKRKLVGQQDKLWQGFSEQHVVCPLHRGTKAHPVRAANAQHGDSLDCQLWRLPRPKV